MDATDDEIFQQLISYLTDEGNVENVSKSFSLQTSNSDRVETAMKLLRDHNLIFPFKTSVVTSNKSSTKSVDLRNKGNKAFQRKDDVTAVMLYTESIAIAPFPTITKQQVFTNNEHLDTSDALSLAFANRSAVLFTFKNYKACLHDIEQAMKYNYPDKLLYKLFERQGKCFMALGKVQSCIESLDNALKWLPLAISLTEDKRQAMTEELKNIIKQAAERKDGQEAEESLSVIPSCSYGKNKEILCASDSVELKYVSGLGRHVVATRQIFPGDVLAVEKPFTSVLLSDSYKTHCYHCLQRSQCLLPCHQCSTVMFCSEDCYESSWNSYHCIDCPILTTLQNLRIGKMGFLALKIVIIVFRDQNIQNLLTLLESGSKCDERNRGFNDNGCYSSEEYSPIYWLVGNTEKRHISDLFRRSVRAALILECLDTMTDFFSKVSVTDTDESTRKSDMPLAQYLVGGVLLRHLQNLPCNAHEVSELVRTKSTCVEKGTPMWESMEIGAAAYAFLSLINHSCDPNVVRHSYQGDTAVLRAIRPIAKGEEVLDNYGYHYALHGCNERRNHLENQYHFTCECRACIEDWPLYDSLPETSPRFLCIRCGHVLPSSATTAQTKNTVISCINCSEPHNIAELVKKISTSSEEFCQNIELVISGGGGNWDEIAQKLISHLKFLDRSIMRPWKEYNDCQEAIKQCFSMTANCCRQ